MQKLGITPPYHKPLWIALSVLLILVGLEFFAILLLNDGHFVFTLDDPYIHLALAQNLLKGHYGINAGECASPSSSLLWPFLIAPFSGFRFGIYGILFLNILSSAGTVFVFWKVLRPPGPGAEGAQAGIFPAGVLISLLLATNLIGLIYLGMEHSLQVFLSAAIVLGLIREAEHGRAPVWLFAAIVAAPCIRFECLSLSLPALTLLFFRGYRAKAILSATLLFGILAGFGIFLKHLGLDAIPLSISAKSPFLASGRGAKAFYDIVKTNLASFQGALLILGTLLFLYTALNASRTKGERALAGALAFSVALHMGAEFVGYNRYEAYILAAMLLTLLHFNRKKLLEIPFAVGTYPALLLLFLAVASLFSSYVGGLLTLPIGSNNIYQQQYQMHRFEAEYYRKPVAVNDLGLVARGNPSYVLDVWGLASREALSYRKVNAPPTDWIPKLAREHGVQLAMIYDEWWFEQNPDGSYISPAGWRKLGVLKLGRMRVTAAESSVSFYALTDSAAAEARPLLLKFRKTLPAGAVFELTDK